MLEASITKRLDREGLKEWLSFLSMDNKLDKILSIINTIGNAKYLLYLKDKGIKVLK